jgi:hypothetical protein
VTGSCAVRAASWAGRGHSRRVEGRNSLRAASTRLVCAVEPGAFSPWRIRVAVGSVHWLAVLSGAALGRAQYGPMRTACPLMSRTMSADSHTASTAADCIAS